jgi:hypothetical protein
MAIIFLNFFDNIMLKLNACQIRNYSYQIFDHTVFHEAN